MALYAHVNGSTVDTVSTLPRLYFDGTVWHDWRGPGPWRTQPSAAGWHPITTTTRPADTGTTTSDESVTLVAGLPVQTWTQRPWTTEELAYRTAGANAETLRAKATTALTANATYLGIGAPSTAQNTAQIKALTRQVQALIRLEVRALADTVGT